MLNTNKNQIDNIISNVNNTSNGLSDLTLIIDNLSESSIGLEKIISQISSGDGSINKLIYDDNLINSLNAASSNINLLVEDLRLNPKRYVHFSLFGKKNKSDNKDDD